MDTTQTIYSQTPSQVFVKNFLAGFARGLGNISIYILFSFAIYSFLIKPRLAQITEFFDSYKKTMEIFQKQPQSPTLDLQNLLNQLQPKSDL